MAIMVVGGGMSRVFGDVEIGFRGIYSGDEFNGYVDVSIPIPPGNRGFFAKTGCRALVRSIRKSYRYNSTTVSHDPADRPNGVEPETGFSFYDFERFGNPSHYRHELSRGIPQHDCR